MLALRFGPPGYAPPRGAVALRFGAQPAGEGGHCPPWEAPLRRVDLRFTQPLEALQGRVDLRLGYCPGAGGDPGEQPELITGTLTATLARPWARFEALPVLPGQAEAALPRIEAAAAALYDINVYRGPSHQAAAPYRQAAAPHTQAGIRWQQGREQRPATAAPWRQGAPCQAEARAPIKSLPAQPRTARARWQDAAALSARRASGYSHPPTLHEHRLAAWEAALRRHDAHRVRYSHPPRADAWRESAWWRWMPRLDWSRRDEWGDANWFPRAWGSRWQQAQWPPYGESVWQPPEEPPAPELYEPDTRLVFCWPAAAPEGSLWPLVFGLPLCPPDEPPGPIVVPIRRVYLVTNNAHLIRVSDGADIPASALTIAIDVDSWGWELRATLVGRAALERVRRSDGEPVEVEAHINGHTWRAVVDRWSASRQFGRGSYSISGRSPAAYLASPYAVPRTYTEDAERTAQQLAAQELPHGWALDWQMPDWLVSAGAWSYANLTPVEAISRIAAAAGGYLQADPVAQALTALPRYPSAPWEWGALEPELTLPPDILTAIGTDWQPRDEANGVYVSGRDQGVTMHVVRAGTAGNLQAPAVVDPLITDVTAARARGIAELAQARRWSLERISLPLAADLGGLITPGKLLALTGDEGWRGLVRGVSVTAGLQDNALRVRQEVTVERHY